jgi:hypothetical protein
MKLEDAKYAVEKLFWWSTNYSFPSPASLYMDLTGYSEETMGEDLCSTKKPSLGYLELDLLGEALMAYAEFPNDLDEEFVEGLLKEYN